MKPLASQGRQLARLVRSLSLRLALAVVVISCLSMTTAPRASAQDVYAEKTLDIARKLQCPVCAGQSVADSTSQLARQMRDIIDQKVQAGESEEQIIDFFVARYGPSVMTEPPKSGFSLALWTMPVIVVLLGALVVTLFVRERTLRTPRTSRLATSEIASSDDDDELETIARDVLGPRAGGTVSGS